MKANVFTGGKLSKAKGVSVAVAIVELVDGDTRETETFQAIQRPNLLTPNMVAIQAAWLGIGVAIARGARELRVFTSSKNTVKAIGDARGASYETRLDAFMAAYAITWTRNLASAGGSWRIVHRPTKDMPEVVEAAAVALKGAEGSLTASGPQGDLLALPV